jgi:hypothetical protein
MNEFLFMPAGSATAALQKQVIVVVGSTGKLRQQHQQKKMRQQHFPQLHACRRQ